MGVRLWVVALLLPLFAVTTFAQEENDVARLYLTDRGLAETQYNFTTFAPTGTDDVQIQPLQTQLRASTQWILSGFPTHWNLSSSRTITAVAFISGLDEQYPLPDVPVDTDAPVPEPQPPDPATLGRLRIMGELFRASNKTDLLAYGESGFDPQPASPRPDVFEFDLVLDVLQDAHLMPNATVPDGFTFRLSVSGRGSTNVSPLRFHILSTTYPARLEVPGFPLVAVQAWERAILDEEECRRRELSGDPCPDATADPTPSSTKPTPASGVTAVLLALALALGSPGNRRALLLVEELGPVKRRVREEVGTVGHVHDAV